MIKSKENTEIWPEEKRQKILSSRYAARKVEIKTAFLFLLFVGLVGGHRIYIGQWKRAIIVTLTSALIFLPWNMIKNNHWQNMTELEKNISFNALGLLLFGLLVFEAYRLSVNVKKYNRSVYRQLSSELRLMKNNQV